MNEHHETRKFFGNGRRRAAACTRFLGLLLGLLVFAFSAANGPCLPGPEETIEVEVDVEHEATPLRFDDGPGPSSIYALEVVPGEGVMGERGALAIVYLDEGTATQVAEDPAFQLRIFVDQPWGDHVLYYSAGRTLLVTERFELLTERVMTEIWPEQDAIAFHLPMEWPGYDGRLPLTIAALGWDTEARFRHPTPLDGLDYYGFEIGRATFPAPSNGDGRMAEVFMGLSCGLSRDDAGGSGTVQECQEGERVDESGAKSWPMGDDGPPREYPGNVYPGWPKKRGDLIFREYESPTGFLKHVHVDLDGDGEIDPGEPNGYVGRCPYEPNATNPDAIGDNKQEIGAGGSTWTSEWKGMGERIVFRFEKKNGRWKLTSTKETKQADGTWAPTGTPIEHDGPYTNPRDVPGPSSF